MTQISKYPVSGAVYQHMLDLVVRMFSQPRDKEETMTLLNDLFTPTERIVIAKRLAIALLLHKKYSYEQIQMILHVSKPTIAEINLAIKYKGNGYKKFVERIEKEREYAKIWDTVVEKTLSVLSYGKGSNVWRYLRDEAKKHKRD